LTGLPHREIRPPAPYRSELSSEARDAESLMLTPEKDDLM
jgi:hypothetical protein